MMTVHAYVVGIVHTHADVLFMCMVGIVHVHVINTAYGMAFGTVQHKQ
jgi:hypothetical protein